MRCSELFDPEIVAIVVEFGDEVLAVVACTCEVGATKADCVLESAREDGAAIIEGADAGWGFKFCATGDERKCHRYASSG